MRLRKLVRVLKRSGQLPYLVVDLVNIRYLTGFAGSYACLIVDGDRSFLISDSRYEEYAKSILPKNVTLVLQKNEVTDAIRFILDMIGARHLYVEGHSTMLSLYESLREALGHVEILKGSDTVNEIRTVKDRGELAHMRRAARIADECMAYLIDFVKAGMTEWEIAVAIEYYYRTHGCRKSSFDVIVASGAGASMPHYTPSMTKRVMPGEVLMIDMGCEYMGYNSDLTRTLFVQRVDPELENIYRLVRKAQEAAIKAVRPGITTGKLDAVARDIIETAGHGEHFGHGLGHGIGMDVHEIPAIRKGEQKLAKNMVVTIEPGVYLPGRGGVRIEDMVLVTATGREVLTKFPKDVIIVG